MTMNWKNILVFGFGVAGYTTFFIFESLGVCSNNTMWGALFGVIMTIGALIIKDKKGLIEIP